MYEEMKNEMKMKGKKAEHLQGLVDELKETNEQLDLEIIHRKQVEEELKKHHRHLEELVKDRTVELEKKNIELEEKNAELEQLFEALKETIAERERAEDKLKEAHKQLMRKEKLAVLGLLSGGVGHELRNPLGVISNAVYYLKTILPDADETTKEYLNIISSEVNNSERIVSDLLNFSRARSPEREETALSELIDNVLSRHAPPKGVTMTTDITEDLPSAYVDPRQMGQVLDNIITNAYQSMPDGGELKIEAKKIKNKVHISFGDTGSGISKSDMGKLFDPLFTTKARGIGLGLSVSNKLIEINGGKIEVESEEGKGSRFTIILPTREVSHDGKIAYSDS